MRRNLSYDELCEYLERKHRIFDEFQKKIRWHKGTDNLYSWKDVVRSIDEDVELYDISESICPSCNVELLNIKLHSVNGQTSVAEVYICPQCLKQFDNNLNELKKPNIDAGEHIIQEEEEVWEISEHIKEINPYTAQLIEILIENGIEIIYCDDAGYYGYYKFDYKGQTLGVWIDTDPTIRLFYPEWYKFEQREDLTDGVRMLIQTINLNTSATIYWLGYFGTELTLSSTINLDLFCLNDVRFDYIKSRLNDLLASKQIFLSLFNGDNIRYIEETDILDKKISSIITILEKSGCTDCVVDEDNDINFKYKERKMYVRFTGNDNVKIVDNYCMVFQNVSEKFNAKDEDPVIIDETLQWNNMIFKTKFSYYKDIDNERLTIFNSYSDINFYFFTYYEGKLINDILNYLSEKAGKQFNDFIPYDTDCDPDTVIEFTNTWFQPDIFNYNNEQV